MSEDYGRLVELVELKELALIELTHQRDEDELRMPLKVEYQLEIQPVTVNIDQLVAKAEFEFKAHPVDDPSREQLAQVEIRMVWRVAYGLRKTNGEKPDVQELGPMFLERNVPINVWPYIRETLANLTAKMGAEPFLLPPLRLVR